MNHVDTLEDNTSGRMRSHKFRIRKAKIERIMVVILPCLGYRGEISLVLGIRRRLTSSL